MLTKSFRPFSQELSELIKKGQTRTARQKMLAVRPSDYPRDEKLEFARLARRMGLHNLALKILVVLVRPTGRKLPSATPAEKAEYAGSLTSIGATTESRNILEGLEPNENPEVLLWRAFAHIAVWDYRSAIPLLDRYRKAPGLSDYMRLIGLANLSAALVFEREPSAQSVVGELLASVDPTQQTILYGYALKLSGEELLARREWKEARQRLINAELCFKDTDSIELLFIRKWLAILDLYENPREKSLRKFRPIRDEAVRRAHWETLRSIDYHTAVALHDDERLTHLLFGTPFTSLREKLIADFGTTAARAESYPWILCKGKDPLEISLESVTHEPHGLKAGGTLHRLLSLLTTDFYRPQRIAEIHANLYPGEYFNPLSSPHRICQLVNRLRRDLGTARLPLEIKERASSYSLGALRACLIQITQGKQIQNTVSLRLEKLEAHLGEKSFPISEATRLLGLPEWTARRMLKCGVEKGAIERTGTGSDTLYRFVKPSKPAPSLAKSA